MPDRSPSVDPEVKEESQIGHRSKWGSLQARARKAGLWHHIFDDNYAWRIAGIIKSYHDEMKKFRQHRYKLKDLKLSLANSKAQERNGPSFRVQFIEPIHRTERLIAVSRKAWMTAQPSVEKEQKAFDLVLDCLVDEDPSLIEGRSAYTAFNMIKALRKARGVLDNTKSVKDGINASSRPAKRTRLK